MNIIIDSVKKIEELTENCGCEEGDIILDTTTDTVICQYERGACMIATFGGKTAEFVTDNPVRARTRLSFLFGAPLDTPPTRAAAAAVVNVLAAFFSLTRVHHACPGTAHMPCHELLAREIAGKQILCIGTMPAIDAEFGQYLVKNVEDAEVILFNGDGITEERAGEIIGAAHASKRIICLGPSLAGAARLNGIEHWCPFGT